MVPWITALGAVGVQSTLLEAFTSIDTGVYDGWVMFNTGIAGYKLHEAAPYHTQVDFGANIISLIGMNLDVYDSLPAEVQEIVVEISKEVPIAAAEYLAEEEKREIEVMKAAGTEFYILPPDERARWAEKLDDVGIARDYVKDAEDAGLPATELILSYIKNCEVEGYEWPVVPSVD